MSPIMVTGILVGALVWCWLVLVGLVCLMAVRRFVMTGSPIAVTVAVICASYLICAAMGIVQF